MIVILIRLLIVAAVLYLIYRLLFGMGSPKPDFKCATCRHCGRMDHDGVICRFGTKETFKNPIHIENCPDHQPRPPQEGA